MKCKLCEDKLLEYLYGELGEQEAGSMEKHLEASEECRQAYEGFASVLETVAGEDEQGPSPALHTRIMGHAEEARPARRSFWAWMFRPAVTTAVIGAVAAGVYFTSLRHKPPTLLDERILSEESLVRKSKRRSAPPSSMAKVELLKKEAKEKGFLARLAESPAAIEQEEAAPEPFGIPERKGAVRVTPPSGKQDGFVPMNSLDEEFASERERLPEKKSQVMAVGSVDKDLAPAQAPKKLEALPAEADRAVGGGMEGASSPTRETRAAPMALSASPGRDLAYEVAPVPPAIERALDLASEGQCDEAGQQVENYTTDHPKEEASGAGWLEVARCYVKKGDTRAAREMAEKALEIPAHESEARAFLATLPP